MQHLPLLSCQTSILPSILPATTATFVSKAFTATMPPAFATQYLDDLVREFLLFRGFTVTYKVIAVVLPKVSD